MLKKTVKLSGILLAICVAMAVLLGVTNEATKGTIALRQQEAKNAAMSEVIPAKNYTLLESIADDHELYAAFNGNDLVGYAVSLSESGYGGEINMMIGIKADRTVSGVSITDMSETPGLGDNAKNSEFMDMFKNLAEKEVALTSDGGKVNALSGATITSKAVTGGVRRALNIVEEKIAGGMINE